MKQIIILLIFIVNINANNLNYVKICVDPDWMPMEKIDEKGKHVGIVADILNLIEAKTNFKFILVPTTSWDESISFIKQKKCDVLPLASEIEERKEWMNFTPVYMQYPEALVIKSSESKKTLEEIIKLPLGLTKGYAAITWFRDKYPNINIIEVENMDDAFAKLRSGEIYSYSDTLPIVGYKLQEEGILDLKISYIFDKKDYSLDAGMAVRKDKIELHRELTKVINNLNEKKLDEILAKWVKINMEDVVVNYTLIYQVLGGIFLIGIIILYWNYKLSLLVKVKTKEIQEFANTLEDKVKEKTKKIRHLLDNVGEGFLTLNQDFLINHEYSKECEIILGDNIAHKDISKIIFKNLTEADTFKKNLNIVLKVKNKNAQKSALTLLPEEITIREKTLSVKYKIIDNSFMLILTDISEKKSLENKIKNDQNMLKMTVAIITGNDVFFDLKNDFEYFMNNINIYIDENKTALYNINEIYRLIHTFKGSFLQLFMDNTGLQLHNVESKLSDVLQGDKLIDNKQLLSLLQDINFATFMDTDLDNIIKVLGKSFLEKNKFLLVEKQSLKSVENTFNSLVRKHKEHDFSAILESIRALSKKSVKSYLDPYVRLALQMSYKANKPIHEFEVIGDENIFLPKKFKNFMNSLVHVFRNTIAHGIENEDIRDDLGKSERGAISCSFSKEKDELKIIIADDGSGIDVDKIKEKAGNSNMSNEEAYPFIFKDNFSTNDEVDELSGRGVGLSAVKSELDLLHGNVEVHSELNIGTRFIFTIPTT